MKKSYFYVALQFSAILILIFTGSIMPAGEMRMILLIIFILIGIWSMYEFKFRFNVFPELKKDHALITSGPYKFVRHPMYTSVLGITFLWLLNDITLLRVIIWILLITILYFKSNYEEQILLNRFPEYSDYKLKTKRIIPFIY